MSTTEPLIWHGCYDERWDGLIVPEAYAHPAKFSKGLIARILSHGLMVGWWQRGDLIGDCFGGVALGGVMAAYAGLGWVGVELEEKFVGLGNQNIALHAARLDRIGDPRPVLLQGDSRRFAEIVGRFDALLTSPPYSETLNHGGGPDTKHDLLQGGQSLLAIKTGYGETTGQIGGLPAGSIDAVLTSPPYAESLQPETEEQTRRKQTRIAKCKTIHDGRKMEVPSAGKMGLGGGYGISEGQIGSLRAGKLDAVVTSPPFGEDQPCQSQTRAKKDYHAFTRGNGTKRDQLMVSPGNISSEGAGETYWQAMAQVYGQCRLALRPSGFMAIVVKDYVKNKARVPLCDQTLALLVRLGFIPVVRIHAMLVKERSEAQLIGPPIVTKRERKSFFRRLAEKKGSPRIDWEEVIVVKNKTAPACAEAD